MPNPLPESEQEIQKKCLNWLLKSRIFAWRNQSTGLFDREKGFFRTGPKRGAPDLIAIKDGQFIGLEIKRPGGKLREDQINFGKCVVDAGGIYWVIRSMEELKEKWYNEYRA